MRASRLLAVLVVLSALVAMSSACKDKEVRTWLNDSLVPKLTAIGNATCNLERELNPPDPNNWRLCKGPGDQYTPPPPPPPK